MYKITSLDEFKHNIYETYEDAQIDALNWYIRHISMYEIGNKGYSIYIKQFIDAINDANYINAINLGCRLTSYRIHIKYVEPKLVSLKGFSDADLKLIDNNLKELVFK